MSSDEAHMLQELQLADHENSSDEIDDGDHNGAWSDGSLPVHGDNRPTPGPNTALPRSLTFVNGLAIIISLQIGAGIFSAPAAVLASVSTPSTALLVWFLAGLLMWTGAAAFAELGIRIPHNGGMQEYLRHCYGDLFGFVFAWAWILLSRPCALAMVSLVFSEYLFRAVMPDLDIHVWLLKAVALLSIAAVTLFNLIGTRTGATAANVFLVLKLLGLGTVAVIGLALAGKALFHREAIFPPSTPESEASSAWADIGGFTDGILASLFAYAGCDSLSFVVGEIKDPHKTVPRIIHGDMAIIMTLFVLSNFAFYHELSKEVLQETNAVAIAFGRDILGEPGAWFYTVIVSLCSLGSLHSMIFSAGRLTQAAGSRDYLPRFLETAAPIKGRVIDSRSRFCAWIFRHTSQAEQENMPANAMLLNAALAVGYVLVGSFRELLSLKAMTELSFYIATVGGIFVLRSRPRETFDRDGARREHYQTSIIYPIIFCMFGSFIVIRSAIMHVFQVLIIAILVGGASALWHRTAST